MVDNQSTICYNSDMTRSEQNKLRKDLRAQGFRARVEQQGAGWRVIVSQIAPAQPASELLSTRVRRRWQRINSATAGPQTTVRSPLWRYYLLDWLKGNGWPYARMLRFGNADAVYELEHDRNFWLILTGELTGELDA